MSAQTPRVHLAGRSASWQMTLKPKGDNLVWQSIDDHGLFSGIRLPYHSTGTPKGHTTTSHVLNDVYLEFDGAFD